MADFHYTARDMKGQKVSGVIAAATDREALTLLSARSLFPLEVSMDRAKTSSLMPARRVSGQTMATTYSQLAALLKSGVPLLRSLGVLRDQCSHRGLKEVLTDVYTRVEGGATLAEAMQRHPHTFNEMSINMVRAGGEGGFLEEALERVAQFTEQYEDLKSQTVGAMAYPVFLGCVGSLVVTVLIVFFVPKFAIMFQQLRDRGELPAATEWLLWMSDTLRGYGLLILLVVAVAALLARARLATDDGRRFLDLMKIRTPMIGNIMQNLAVARFCRVLGAMLRNGVQILKSLEISRQAAGNRVLAEAIAEASENISAGQSLAAPLAASGYFPVAVVEMISVAEESNTLDTVLIQIAESLEKRTLRRLDLTVRLLEPAMLLVLAGVVLFVVMALLMPVIKMSGQF